jgi:hypothetical protein
MPTKHRPRRPWIAPLVWQGCAPHDDFLLTPERRRLTNYLRFCAERVARWAQGSAGRQRNRRASPKEKPRVCGAKS